MQASCTNLPGIALFFLTNFHPNQDHLIILIAFPRPGNAET
ncbi:hypothetical protein [uncultured Methanospirillum sp.]|nr:hypothetical protein [uncultured Methanospirillum sp.]